MQAARDVWAYKSAHDDSGVRAATPKPLGRFLLSPPIARGGMARVHLGVAMSSPHEVVAVKRLLPHLAVDGQYEQMFADEASIATTIRHRNVVRSYGTEVLEGETVLVMEYVPGLSVAEVVRASHGRLPPRFAIAIVAAALRGLHAAHKQGIVHRDVSPQNIMVGADGVPRIFDFGIAVGSQRRRTQTRAGEIKGKLAYMAPEQLGLDPHVDARVDIHAAGIILWEALVGTPLFLGESEAATLGRVLEREVIAPSLVVNGIPRDLDAIVLRALAKDPNDRFPNALEMATALESVIGICPVSSEELARWVRGLAGERLTALERLRLELLAAFKPAPPALRPQLTVVMDDPKAPMRPELDPGPVDEVHQAPAIGDVFLVGVLILLAGLGGALLMRMADHVQFGI